MLLRKRMWAVLLIGLLVAGLLVGFGDGEEAIAKEPRATIGKIMVGAAAFTPAYENATDSYNSGIYLTMDTGPGLFVAEVRYPVPVVNIRKITLVAYDNTPGLDNSACLWFWRAHPFSATAYQSGAICTGNSSDDPQRVVTTTLSARKVNTVNHSSVVQVRLGAPGIILYGVQVVYSY